jgi:predicted metal-dependent phosphoesterase TrpH
VDVAAPSAPHGRRLVIEWDADDRPRTRAALRALRGHPDWAITILRTVPLSGRPYVPSRLRARTSVVSAFGASERADALHGAAAFLPAAAGSRRLLLEAEAAGLHVLDEVTTARLARALEAPPTGRGAQILAEHGIDRLGEALEALYERLTSRRRVRRPAAPLGDRPWILADLHMHTEHSHDCSTPVADLLDHAEAIGLGAIAITDHNVFAGAREAVALARGRDLVVIPGEEVKTERGEVIGLFLEEQIPRGMTMAETVASIRGQGGLVYLPHPFDRLHAIPRPETLHRMLDEIDVLEVFNARLLFDAYNDEALRFARKYNLFMGAGSDAHVLQGVGTGMVRMRAFDGPEEFLLSLRSAEIVRRPKSLLYLQGLKWVAQARERRGRPAADRLGIG